MDTTYPAAYLRRSYVDDDSPGDISLDAQRAAVRTLAQADGHNGNLVEYNDWGVSADVAKASKRIEYVRLLADMEAGRIIAVYAFDVDRLYRDPRDLIRLQDAALAHRVRIVTTAGPLPILDDDDPAAEGFAWVGAVFGRMELRKAKKRARAAVAARRARNDAMGRPAYGYRFEKVEDTGRWVEVRDPTVDLEPVIQAYRLAGTILGAAHLLTESDIPAPRGGRAWGAPSVRRILMKNAPDLLPRMNPRGRRQPSRSTLSQLLRCPFCLTLMTPTGTGKYYCRNGARDRAIHPRYALTERFILPWMRDEAARLMIPSVDGDPTPDPEDRRAAIEETFRRVARAYAAGGLSDQEFDDAKRDHDADLSALADLPVLVEVPDLDWSASPAKVNAVLRALWRWVELDERLRPTRAEWLVPEWRRDGDHSVA